VIAVLHDAMAAVALSALSDLTRRRDAHQPVVPRLPVLVRRGGVFKRLGLHVPSSGSDRALPAPAAFDVRGRYTQANCTTQLD
jgi:hypothetical protein